MSLETAEPTDPLLFDTAIVDENGNPTPYFMRQWASQQIVNDSGDGVIDAVIALQNIDLIAGTGLEGGGDLTADRTFALTTTSLAYDLGIYMPGIFTDAQLLLQFVFARNVTFADDFAGSTGLVGVNPTSAATIDVLKNDVSIGTISITTGGVVTFVTAGSGAETFGSGDKLTLVNQGTADATLSDVSVTFQGTKA